MKTLTQSTCPGLSGNNILTYEVGMENDETYWLRLIESSGGGFLCKDWISVDAAIETLKKAASPFTSYAIHTHFNGKSANSPAFFMAALRHEELVTPDQIKRQAFVADNIDTALEKFQSRMSKGIAVSSPAKKKRPPRKAKTK